MRRKQVSEGEWAKIQGLLPNNSGKLGRNYRDHRQVVEGILWRLRVGAPWRDIPDDFGPWSTVYCRYRTWIKSGLWHQIFQYVHTLCDDGQQLDWSAHFVDGTIVRAHQKAAGATNGDSGLGWSRGGLTTKIHVRFDRKGYLLNVEVTEGHRNEITAFEKLMNSGAVKRKWGRPKLRPDAVVGDKGYNANWLRKWASNKHMACVVPKRSNQMQKGPFNKSLYRERNLVERRIAHYKEYRALAFRFEKLSTHYQSNWEIVSIFQNLKKLIG